MIFSLQQLFSDAQAITATAASTNHIDLGAQGVPYGANAQTRDQGKGNKVPVLIQVVADFNTLTSLNVAIQQDDDNAFGTAEDVVSQDVVLADLVAGKQIAMDVLPRDLTKRYVRLNYTVTGSAPTTGAVTAGITMGNQTNG